MDINTFKLIVYIALTLNNKEYTLSAKVAATDTASAALSSTTPDVSTSTSKSSDVISSEENEKAKDELAASSTTATASAVEEAASTVVSSSNEQKVQSFITNQSHVLSSLNAENRKIIDELNDKQKIAGLHWIGLELDSKCEFNDPLTLKRFFIGHNQKVDAAFKALFECIKWRQGYGADNMIADWEALATTDKKVKLLQNTFPVGLLNVRHEDRPIFLYRFVMVDFPRYFELCGLELLMKMTVYYLERIVASATKTGDSIMIMDLGFTKGMDVDPPIKSLWEVQTYISYLMKYLKPLTGIADPYYPETNHIIIFTRAPTVFWGVWKVVSLLIAERTKQKVVVYTSDKPQDDLAKHLPLSAIPDVLGGQASTAHLPKGGAIAKDALEKI